jgi:hypothetical protein
VLSGIVSMSIGSGLDRTCNWEGAVLVSVMGCEAWEEGRELEGPGDGAFFVNNLGH